MPLPRRLALTAAVLLATMPLAVSAQQNTANPTAQTIADFTKRVDAYVALHKKLEDTLPPLPKQTTPAQVDAHQRALVRLMQQERATAKQGDLFAPAMQAVVRRLLRPIFAGKSGLQIKNEILDNEYKGNVRLTVNGRYPDEIPLSTMPPQVLKQLPRLPEELEYRFVRTNLILLDPHAHTIADWVERAFH